MKKSKLIIFFPLLFTFFIMSCSNDPLSNLQGVYEVDKESLKELLRNEVDQDNAFAMGLLNVAIENAIVEFIIKNDSIKGIIFLAGEATLLDSHIQVRNDSLVMNTDDSEAYLFPTDSSLLYKAQGAELPLELFLTDRTELTPETEDAIEIQKQVIKEKEEFENNLGVWQKGDYVDEFGDETGEGFAYCIVRGSHDNSISLESEVFVKASVQDNTLFFEIFDSSLSMKESLPDIEFGTMKLKFPDNSVQSERVFFYNNTVSESPSNEKNILYNYLIENSGAVKVLIDLSTASEYYSDKYQFSISRNNLVDLLNEL